MSSNKNGWFFAFITVPVLVGAAYGISSLLTVGEPAGGTDSTDMSVAYGLLLWVGAPIAFVAVLPILFGILKALTKTGWLARAADHLGRRR
ncbi:hypothetical protein N8723_04540 [Luminiphilus sp.]|nr:hypothetical protein [Luminiphilus sp.]